MEHVCLPNVCCLPFHFYIIRRWKIFWEMEHVCVPNYVYVFLIITCMFIYLGDTL